MSYLERMLLTCGGSYDRIIWRVSKIKIDYLTKVCYICNIKGKARDTRPTPNMSYKSLTRPAVTIGSSGGLFFALKDLINKTNKSHNEYTYLDKIRICNIHWHPPPFRWRDKPLLGGRVGRLYCALTFRKPSIT